MPTYLNKHSLSDCIVNHQHRRTISFFEALFELSSANDIRWVLYKHNCSLIVDHHAVMVNGVQGISGTYDVQTKSVFAGFIDDVDNVNISSE